MMKIRKGFNAKIVAMLVAVVFLFHSTVYAIDLPRKSHLRTPLMGNSKDGQKRLEETLHYASIGIGNVVRAENDAHVSLFGIPKKAVWLPDGNILLTQELYDEYLKNKLEALQVIVHEMGEALLQALKAEESSRYERMKEIAINHLAPVLYPENTEQNVRRYGGDEALANHIWALIFEHRLMGIESRDSTSDALIEEGNKIIDERGDLFGEEFNSLYSARETVMKWLRKGGRGTKAAKELELPDTKSGSKEKVVVMPSDNDPLYMKWREVSHNIRGRLGVVINPRRRRLKSANLYCLILEWTIGNMMKYLNAEYGAIHPIQRYSPIAIRFMEQYGRREEKDGRKGAYIELNTVEVLIGYMLELINYFDSEGIKSAEPESYAAIRKILEALENFSEILEDSDRLFIQQEAKAVDINSLLAEIAQEARGINPLIEIEEDYKDTLARVVGNESELGDVFFNILINAFTHAFEPFMKGKVTVSTRLDDDRIVIVEISDNGKGIPEENLERVPIAEGSTHLVEKIFSQGFTISPKGEGLGLFTSYIIIEAHHGTIEVQSEVGKGTTFTIRLPTTAQLASAAEVADEMEVPVEELIQVQEQYHSEMLQGLSGAESSLKMYPAYVQAPTGKERGDYYFVDAGGSNLRVGGTTLNGDGTYKDIGHSKTVPFSPELKEKTAHAVDLFDFITNNIADYIEANDISTGSELIFGLTWSFPAQLTGIASGVHVKWTKEWKTQGVVGEDPVRLLYEAIQRNPRLEQYRIHIVALCNDTVGTFATGRHSDQDCVEGVILGTGTNASYSEDVQNITKLQDESRADTDMCINQEWGAFNRVRQTAWDKTLDQESNNTGEQILEKMVSGMYLGELCRLILKGFIDRGALFGGESSPAFDMKWDEESNPIGFQTRYMSRIHADKTDTLEDVERLLKEIGIENSTLEDRQFIRDICTAVARRGARISSAVMDATITKNDPGLTERDRYAIAIDGSLFKQYPFFRESMKEALRELHGENAEKIDMIPVDDGSGIGAAIIAAVAHTKNTQDSAAAVGIPRKVQHGRTYEDSEIFIRGATTIRDREQLLEWAAGIGDGNVAVVLAMDIEEYERIAEMNVEDYVEIRFVAGRDEVIDLEPHLIVRLRAEQIQNLRDVFNIYENGIDLQTVNDILDNATRETLRKA